MLTSVKTTGLPIKNIQYPTIIICGQGSNVNVPKSALLQHIIEYGNISDMSGPQAVLLAGQENDKSLFDSIEDLTEDYLKLMFPFGNEPHSLELSYEMIDLMTSRNPDSKIRAKVATEGGYDPCAADDYSKASSLFKRHNGGKNSIIDNSKISINLEVLLTTMLKVLWLRGSKVFLIFATSMYKY